MPPLFEGSSLYMPTALPGISIAQAIAAAASSRTAIIRALPGSGKRFRRSGPIRQRHGQRAPRYVRHHRHAQAARAMAAGNDIRKADSAKWMRSCSFPDFPIPGRCRLKTVWTWQLTGIKTPLGMKIQGPNRSMESSNSASQIQQVSPVFRRVRSVFAERVSQGFYVNVEVNRAEAARYGLTVADVQQAVASGIGGENIAENVEGRERYPINVRYQRDFRDDVDELRRVLIGYSIRRADSDRAGSQAFRSHMARP